MNPEEAKVPKKVSSTQRPRASKKEDDQRRKQTSPEELLKLKRCHELISRLITQVDPFSSHSIESSVFGNPSACSESESQGLFKEYLFDPQKHRKSNFYIEFVETKKRFDLVLNKEDPGQDIKAAERYRIYFASLPSTHFVQKALVFLSNVRERPPAQRQQRVQVLRESSTLRKGLAPVPTIDLRSIKKSVLKDLEDSGPVEDPLSLQELLILLRSIPKHLGNWEKTQKEFKEHPPSIQRLKQEWHCLKAAMKQEVSTIRQKNPTYHFIKWVRAAARKVETQLGKNNNKKPLHVIDATHRAKRVDILAVMSQADELDAQGMESSKELEISASSCFKKFKRY